MSWSCPFHSFQLPLHVSDIFSVCPCHFPCMSRSFVASHLPTSPVVPIGFIVLCFPVIPPALPSSSFLSLSCPFQFPFVSLSFPVAFLTCGLPIFSPHFLALPCISPLLPSISRKKNIVFPAFSQRGVQKHRVFPDFSLHFLAFFLAPQYFPQTHTVFPAFSQRGHPKTQSFPDFLQKQAGNPNQQKAGRGNRAWDPCFATGSPKTTFSGTSSNRRAVRGGGTEALCN